MNDAGVVAALYDGHHIDVLIIAERTRLKSRSQSHGSGEEAVWEFSLIDDEGTLRPLLLSREVLTCGAQQFSLRNGGVFVWLEGDGVLVKVPEQLNCGIERSYDNLDELRETLTCISRSAQVAALLTE